MQVISNLTSSKHEWNIETVYGRIFRDMLSILVEYAKHSSITYAVVIA